MKNPSTLILEKFVLASEVGDLEYIGFRIYWVVGKLVREVFH